MMEDFRLKVFLTVASSGSFTRAAALLGVSQPAVSQNVAELEKSLGTALFTRGRGTVALTPEGRVLRGYAERIQSGYEALDALFGAGRVRSFGRPVVIATTEFVAAHLLPRVLDRISVMTSAVFDVRTLPEAAFSATGALEPADIRLYPAPVPGEGLDARIELHFDPDPSFEAMSLCRQVRRALEDSLQNGIFAVLVDGPGQV